MNIVHCTSALYIRSISFHNTDMDDPNTTITSQFGHSSQELINLLLTGQAVSNVFDNTMTISDDLQCHGIQSRPAIGYLSILESLRYCEVGGYYKCPLFPIWVVGSTSHFTVLFGDETCLKESKSDMLLEQCRREFQKVSENGFIPVDKLGDVLNELDLTTKVGGENGVQALKAYLEVSGAGIILWDDFWKASSRLMTGSSIEALMSSQDNDVMQVDDDDDVPLLITQYGESNTNNDGMTTPPPATAAVASARTTQQQSDEELARKLAAEWGSMPDDTATTATVSDGGGAKSDEDYARELQAQWDAEMAGGGGGGGINDPPLAGADIEVAMINDAAAIDSSSLAAVSSLAPRPSTPIQDVKMGEPENENQGTAISTAGSYSPRPENKKMPAKTSQQLEFEKHGLSFPLYHYNGLYGGTLTPFRLTRLSATEAVGASIALSSGAGHHGAGGGDLEDVVRTKWPSSMVNWFGAKPSID